MDSIFFPEMVWPDEVAGRASGLAREARTQYHHLTHLRYIVSVGFDHVCLLVYPVPSHPSLQCLLRYDISCNDAAILMQTSQFSEGLHCCPTLISHGGKLTMSFNRFPFSNQMLVVSHLDSL